MAEFKLGRLRFVWKGVWASSTQYTKDDIVRYGGKVYVCMQSHTATSDFYVDLNNADWNLMSDGIEWIGAWANSTYYKVGDIVSHGAKTWICLTGHTSSSTAVTGFASDQTAGKWQILNSGLAWRGNWASATTYYVNDVVRFGANTYVAVLDHASSTGLPNGNPFNSGFYTDLNAVPTKWQVFTSGVEFAGTWTGTTFYQANDIVTYGGSVYICNTGHTSQSTLEADQSKWTILVTGFNPTGTWSQGVTYKINDLVKFGADQYICNTAHTSSSQIDLAKFTLFVQGLEFQNSWSNSTNYAIGDVVTYGGYVYQSNVSNNLNSTPSTVSANWALVTTGFNVRGTWSNITSYKTGDVVTYGAYVYVALVDSTGTNPAANPSSWSLLSTGIKWVGTWTSGTVYKLGDAVSYGSSSYICVSAHTAATGSRPDNDSSGTYWNSLSQGAATNVMTTTGDTVYYGGSGPARLPIGTQGQLLRVSNTGIPSWYSYGLLQDVYYVAPTGTDSTSAGWSIDNPWKTISYACQQVAAGPNNPNAKWLLSQNKTFIQAEIDNYMLYTYKASTTGTSAGAFTTANTAGLNVGMPIIFSNLIGITKSVSQTYATQSLTVSSSTGSVITVSSTMSGVTVNQPITFSASFGNVVASTVYYVQSASGTSLSISTTAGGSAYAVGSGGTGTASVQGTLVLNNTTGLTVNSTFQLSGTAFGGLNSSGTTYYVSNVVNSTLITVSLSASGPVVTGISAATGTLTLNTGNNLQLNGSPVSTSTTYYVQSISSNTSFTVAATYGGGALTATGTGASTGTFSYSSTKAKRDAGDVLDGIIYDLGRGGNMETTINAAKFFLTETSYITTYFSYMILQVVGSLTYMSTLLGNILAQSAPSNNYQSLMSVGSPVTQTTNGSYVAESGTTSKSQSLVTIVTNALNAGTTLAIPQSTKPSIQINIKVGSYTEVLPIVVPAFTSLVGDELRSVFVQPYTFTATATTSSANSLTVSDSTGIVSGMGLSGNAFIPDGTTVTNVSGNVLTLSANTTGTVTGTITAGYTASNMFLMRDGTVARNMTLKGLIGGLSTANGYGTKRPTAGAYFSLDPGTGVNDETVWINTRSPYMQNCTLFGQGCVGMKVDGSLHAGGNHSMVANDFTNILSDGIAIWTLYGALVEAVSVFSYYGYAGYLSETGGYIRATNGNSSYGTYGVVAEGTLPTETPITGAVNTRSQGAQIANVLLGSGQIQWLEYSNAGQSYSSSTYTITSGTGVGAVVASPNYFTNAVNEVRLITGGAGYVTASNVGQGGNATTIQISAADTAATNGYNGMRVVLTAGTGAGQYGYINSYNAGTKTAIILKESVAAISTSSCNTATFTVSSTANIPVGTAVVFTGTAFGGISTNTVYYVVSANFTSTTFSIATSLGGSALTLSAASGTMSVNVSGWDTAISGGSVAAALDGSTRYTIEPRVTFSGTGSGAFARAVVVSNQISAIRIIQPGTGYTVAPTMTITDPNMTSTATWSVQTAASGVLGQPTWTSRGTGYIDAAATVSGNGFADIQPVGYFLYLSNLTKIPNAGSNVVFTGNSNYYILVQVLSYTGTAGNYSAYVQINPGLTVSTAPTNGTTVTITQQYSQSRLTGHDFLYVGSGNYYSTGFPSNFNTANYIQANQTINSGGGRVFFTSTDQNGNFNVGNLFVVQQSTGVATLSANLFNLSGLNNLQFASGGANITQFSPDGSMTANSDALVPTQRAVRAYIASQLGAGGSNITANSLQAGSIYASGTTLTTVNSNNLTIATTGTSITLGSATTQITTLTRGQTTFAPSATTDVTNKTYVDSSIKTQALRASYFYSTMG